MGMRLFGERKRLLLIASTGGHLTQLIKIAEREGAAEDSLWVTFDSPQSRALLAGRPVLWVDYVAPRDLRGTIRAYRRIAAAAAAADFDGALSTGAAVGLAGLWWAKQHGLPRAYIESISRTEGPSLTGKMVNRLRIAPTFTQHATWASRSWKPVEPVLSQFSQQSREAERSADEPLRILVTLGTIRPYRFDSLVDRVAELVKPGDEITWQLGVTAREGLPGETHELIGADELLRRAREADVVVTHSGVGTILQLLDEGISPVVVPRRRERGEHIDDHQLQIFELLRSLDLGHPVEVEAMDRAVLASAASHRVIAQAAA